MNFNIPRSESGSNNDDNKFEYWSILPYLGQALVDRLNEPETWQRYRALYEERNLSDLLDLVEAGGAQ